MKKALEISFLAVGCLTLVASPATAQFPPEIEQIREGRYGLLGNPNHIFRNLDDINSRQDRLTFNDGDHILIIDIPMGPGTDACATDGRNLPEGLRQATGWIDNGDGTVSFTDQVDMRGCE